MRKHEKGSGVKLNTTKTEAMWLGRWRNNSDTPYGPEMRILGVFFSNGLLSVENQVR